MARRLLALAVSATALQAPHAKAPSAPLSATATAPAKTGPTWDDHVAIPEAPDTLVKGVDGNDSMRRKFEKMLREAQNKICSAVEELDGEGTFRQDVWERENGGGGISRVMAGGRVWEKAGCSLSVVYGSMPQEALASATERGVDRAKGMEPGERVPFCVEINQCVGCTRQFFTKSFLGDDAAAADLARSSGEEPASPRHRAGIASMTWRTTR